MKNTAPIITDICKVSHGFNETIERLPPDGLLKRWPFKKGGCHIYLCQGDTKWKFTTIYMLHLKSQ